MTDQKKTRVATPPMPVNIGADEEVRSFGVDIDIPEAAMSVAGPAPVLKNSEEEMVSYFAIAKSQILVIQLKNAKGELYDHAIEFVKGEYPTNNPVMKKAIESSPSFGIQVFKGAYPDYLQDIFKARRLEMSKDQDVAQDTLSERYRV